MTVRVSAGIHFSEADVSRNWHPADDKCHAYGVLKFGPGTNDANIFFGTPGQIDRVIAELVALKQEMAPPVIGVPAPCPGAYSVPGAEYYCSLDAGHAGLHAQLTATGAFIAEWGFPDGGVHTTSGHHPAPSAAQDTALASVTA